MKCREAESLVQQYIDDTLPPKKLEAFISHVQSCSSCYEELEIHFIIHHAIKYLDEDRHDSYDMKAKLSEDLLKKEKRLRKKYNIKVLTIYVLVLAAIIGIGLLVFMLFPELLQS